MREPVLHFRLDRLDADSLPQDDVPVQYLLPHAGLPLPAVVLFLPCVFSPLAVYALYVDSLCKKRDLALGENRRVWNQPHV